MGRKRKEEKYTPVQKTLTIPQAVVKTTFKGDAKAAVRFIHRAFARLLEDAQNEAIGQTNLLTQTTTTDK